MLDWPISSAKNGSMNEKIPETKRELRTEINTRKNYRTNIVNTMEIIWEERNKYQKNGVLGVQVISESM